MVALAQPSSGDAPAASPTPTAPAASATPNQLNRVEVRGGPSANSRRRLSTASKIVIDREELERLGDTALGDVLRRLPGVTLGGRPGRGGDIRMRGLGSGFTQILIDGERAPAGFAVEDLPPDQVERIEVYRAPTAATGARAIAGTINIILREPLQKSNQELRLGIGSDRNEPQADFSWTRNLTLGHEPVGAVSINGGHRRRFNNIDSGTRITDSETGQTIEQTTQVGMGEGDSSHLNGNARLRWKLSDTLSINASPTFAFSQSSGDSQAMTEGTRFRSNQAENQGRMHNLRLNLSASYRPQAGESWELRVARGNSQSTNNSLRRDLQTLAGLTTERLQEDRNTTEEDHTSAGAKWSLKTAQEHQWVTGAEAERSLRSQYRDTLVNGLPLPGLVKFGKLLASSSHRVAVYTQNEWSPTQQWSLYAGIRYEQIETRADAAADLPATRNTSRVASPLFHLLWKPAGFPKDQVRLSLTRSYRSPNLNDLIARPSLNTTTPEGPNYQTSPDRAGNPGLKPELATGLDLSLEHWLPTGGIISGSAFVTHLQGVIRHQVLLETVPWDSAQRWVSRPRNAQGAKNMGLQFELKARLDELWEDAPPELQMMLLRVNVAVFKSVVKGIPGTNNRLDQQPRGSLNLGLDHRWKALGTTFGSGFNFNLVPASTVQVTETLRRQETARRQFDAYLSWATGAVRDGINWRLSLANILPRDAASTSQGLSTNSLTGRQSVTDSWSRNKTFMVINLRADMRF